MYQILHLHLVSHCEYEKKGEEHYETYSTAGARINKQTSIMKQVEVTIGTRKRNTSPRLQKSWKVFRGWGKTGLNDGKN